MWPKLLMQFAPQLVELLPHVKRLLPMADQHLQTSAANEKAMAEMATELQGSLGQVAAALGGMAGVIDGMGTAVQGSLGRVAQAHTDMATKLDAFVGQMGEVGTEAKRARRAAELAQTRVDTLEKQMAGMRTMLLAGLGIVAVLLLAVLVLLVRGHVGTAL